ncbi:macro domain-containing protein CT2219-like [Chelonus insularis]|uniref:macro domain-containing protein CT2219-like n=1 Tax=Chelonus insularis TaxID=460826 RepID=UPI00158DD3ED|nr:macro domain-containing protein CT2219-like [Chelonus insularis]
MLLKVLKPSVFIQFKGALDKISITSLSIFSTTAKMSFQGDKDKFLKMNLEDKRKHYQTSKVTALDEVLTWPEYFAKNKIKDDTNLANKISMWQGDITSLEIDAIVNAANSSLLGGGGVDGAIHRAAGPSLKKECASLGGCNVGEAKITGGYKLPAKYVIHTVGPRGEKPEMLKKCYLNSLELAKENGVKTIAFPCISTGVYGYPQRPAAEVAITTVKQFLEENKDQFERVIFCLFLQTDKDIYENLLQKYFPLA